MAFLTSQMFTVSAILLGLFFAACAVYLAWTGPRRKAPVKELSFGVTSAATLLAAAKSVENEASMTYKGRIVQRLSAVTLSIMNTGQLPIAVEDFDHAARVTLEPLRHIFSVTLLRCSPAHLKPNVSQIDSDIFVAPLLLNPGDFLTLRVVLDSADRVTGTLEARVAGVGTIPSLYAGRHPGYDIWGVFFWGGLTLLSTAASIASGLIISYWFAIIFIPFLALSLAAVIASVRDIISLKRSRWMGNETEDLGVVEGVIETLHGKRGRR